MGKLLLQGKSVVAYPTPNNNEEKLAMEIDN